MSKAFTRESDDLPERSAPPRLVSLLPPGVKNYLTSDGARRLQEELNRLVEVERPRAMAAPEASEERRRLQAIDQRMAELYQCLNAAVVVPPPPPPWEQVRFGATVTVRERDDRESRYRIVGAGETDADRGCISWLSPLAKALLNAKTGHRVRFKMGSGEEELAILSVTYEQETGSPPPDSSGSAG